MRGSVKQLGCLLGLVLFLTLAPVRGQAAATGKIPVNVEADQLEYDKATGRYLAHGNVVLTYEEMTLRGDDLWWHPDTGHAQITGHAQFETDEELLTGDLFWVDLESGTGFANNGTLWLRKKNTYIRGRSLERLGPAEYRVRDGRFTTCEGEDPSWEFGARQVDVTVGGFARITHGVFYVQGIPLAYSPYLTYPVKRERESGFLMPRFGHSSSKGTQLSVAWYQVIGVNQDATFYLDYLDKLGVGSGAEYRYIFGEDQRGEAKLYGIAGKGEVEDQLAVNWEHRGRLGDHTRLIADIEWVSENDYFSDFGEVAEEYNKSSTTSVLSTTSHWDRVSLGTQLKYLDNLETSNDTTLQLLPEVRFSLLRSPVEDRPIFTQLETRYTHFWREEGLRGHRLLLRPVVAGVTQPFGSVALDAQVGWWQRFYWTEEGERDQQSKGVPDLLVRLSSRLSRTYDLSGEWADRALHSVEPEIRWSYAPDTDQGNLPTFDFLDRIDSQNLVTFGLLNRVALRLPRPDAPATYLDLLYFRLSQSLALDKGPGRLNQEGETWLPLRSELVLQPNRQWTLDLDHRLRWSDGKTDRFFAEGRYHTPDRRHRVAVGYRYDQDVYEYLHLTGNTAVLHPVYLTYSLRYDLVQTNTLEQVLGLEYRHQCWTLFATLTDREDEQSFLVGLSLSGLGRVGTFGGNLGGSGDD